MAWFNSATGTRRAAAVLLLTLAGMGVAGCSAAPSDESTAAAESALGGGKDDPGLDDPVCPVQPPVTQAAGQCSLHTYKELFCPSFGTADAKKLGCSEESYYRFDP